VINSSGGQYLIDEILDETLLNSPIGVYLYPLETNILLFNILYGLVVSLAFSVTVGIVYMILVSAKKDLRYYLAKTCFEVISKDKDQTTKANYLIMGIVLWGCGGRSLKDLHDFVNLK
jgi:hypothetical protein